MKFKSEKGFTGVDIAIAIVVLFIFVSIISILSYSVSSSAKELELKSKATYLAIDELEKMKNLDFEDIADYGENCEKGDTYIEKDENEQDIVIDTVAIDGEEGFYRTILINDYKDIDSTKIEGLVKKVTVQISYMFKAKTEVVELSTVLSKEV